MEEAIEEAMEEAIEEAMEEAMEEGTYPVVVVANYSFMSLRHDLSNCFVALPRLHEYIRAEC